VFGEIPLARDTAAIPPRPSTRASDAAQIRRPRSLNSGAKALNRSPISASSITPHSFYDPERDPACYLSTRPKTRIRSFGQGATSFLDADHLIVAHYGDRVEDDGLREPEPQAQQPLFAT